MDEIQIVKVGNLQPADLERANLKGNVARWKKLDKETMLDIGNGYLTAHGNLQLLIGAWLHVFVSVRKHGSIKEIAAELDRKPGTLTKWKHTYERTQNVQHAEHSTYDKLAELARIPAEHQSEWLPAADFMKRDEFRKAITEAKANEDWTPPANDKELPVIIMPESESPPEPETEQLPPEIMNMARKVTDNFVSVGEDVDVRFVRSDRDWMTIDVFVRGKTGQWRRVAEATSKIRSIIRRWWMQGGRLDVANE